MNYFRISAYYKEENFSCILDSNGMFEKLWQFSAYLVSKGFNIISANRLENISDTNIDTVEEDKEHIFLRATQDDKAALQNNTITVENMQYTVAQ